MEIMLLLWVASAVIAAAIASTKRRSVAGWAMLGLLIGIAAPVIVACLRRLPLPPGGRLDDESASVR